MPGPEPWLSPKFRSAFLGPQALCRPATGDALSRLAVPSIGHSAAQTKVRAKPCEIVIGNFQVLIKDVSIAVISAVKHIPPFSLYLNLDYS